MSSYEARTNPRTGKVSHRVRYRLGTGPTATNKAVTFTTEQAARSWQAVLDNLGPGPALQLLREPAGPQASRTVADQVDHHIAHLTGIDEGTRRRYQRIADRAIRPAFAAVLLTDLTRDLVADWVNAVRLADGTEPAAKTLHNWHGLLSAALAAAVDAQLIDANPAYRMRLPRLDQGDEMVFLTADEFRALLAELDPYWHPLVLLLALTGLRWGEATALRVCDVDVDAHRARVVQAWKHTESQGYRLGPPKSRRSRRTIVVPDPVMTALVPLMDGKGPGEIIIRNHAGRPVRSSTFHGRVWQPAVRRFAGDVLEVRLDSRGRPEEHVLERGPGKHPRIHDLRHTYASWAIQDGVQLPQLQRAMGHESITTTVDRYVHLVPEDLDGLMRIGDRLAPPRPVLTAIR